MNESINYIHKNRIVAYDVLFKMQDVIHEKRISTLTGPKDVPLKALTARNANLDDYLATFEATELTSIEASVLNNFRSDLTALRNLEQPDKFSTERYMKMLDRIDSDLQKLASIQLKARQDKMLSSDGVNKRFALFNRLEIYGILGLALIIQILILYRKE